MFILDSIGFGSAFALLIPLSYTPDVAFEISGAWFAAPSVIIMFYFLLLYFSIEAILKINTNTFPPSLLIFEIKPPQPRTSSSACGAITSNLAFLKLINMIQNLILYIVIWQE